MATATRATSKSSTQRSCDHAWSSSIHLERGGVVSVVQACSESGGSLQEGAVASWALSAADHEGLALQGLHGARMCLHYLDSLHLIHLDMHVGHRLSHYPLLWCNAVVEGQLIDRMWDDRLWSSFWSMSNSRCLRSTTRKHNASLGGPLTEILNQPSILQSTFSL